MLERLQGALCGAFVCAIATFVVSVLLLNALQLHALPLMISLGGGAAIGIVLGAGIPKPFIVLWGFFSWMLP